MTKRAVTKLASVAIPALLLCHPAFAAKMPPGKELRGFLSDSCIASDEPYYLPPLEGDQVAKGFPLASPIVSKIALAMVDGIIKLAASGMSDAAGQKDLRYVEAYDIDLYQATLLDSPDYDLNERFGCVTVVAASFEPAGTDCTHRYIPKTVPPSVTEDDMEASVVRDDPSIENILRRANVCVDGVAHSVFEARVSFSKDRTAFRMESAGLWVDSLLSTKSRRAKRSIIYTFDIAEPGTGSKPKTLAVASVPVGIVTAGLQVEDGTQMGRSDWIAVPPLSTNAANAYERDNALHKDLYAELQSLERSVVRNRRVFEGMKARVPNASEEAQRMLKQEMANLEYKLLHMESLLDARRLEYDELPKPDRYYMPVTIGIGLIESKSERRAFTTLAAFLEDHRVEIVDTAESVAFERSADLLDSDSADQSLEQTRQEYFDALVAVEEARTEGEGDVGEAEDQLSKAKLAYNAARTKAGIAAID